MTDQEPSPSAKRRFFYGWVVVLAGMMIMAFNYSYRGSFSFIYSAILDEFGWRRGETALIFSTGFLAYGLLGPVSGLLVDRFGSRRVIIMGATISAVGIAVSSQVNQIWQFVIFFGMMTGAGSALAGNVPNFAILSNWFVRKRGMAFGMIVAGFNCNFLIAWFVEYIISIAGWRIALFSLAAMVVATIIPLTILFLRQRPEDMGLSADGVRSEIEGAMDGQRDNGLIADRKWAAIEWTVKEASKNYRFWCLLVASFLSTGLAYSLMIGHQVRFLVDAGYEPLFVGSVIGLFGAVGIIGSFCSGLSDYIGREMTYTIAYLGAVIAIIVLSFIRSSANPWMLYLYVVCFGFFSGLGSPALNACIADLFQGRHFAAINGCVVMGYGVGGFIGPLLGGYVFDTLHTYVPAFQVAILALLIAVALIWVAAPRKLRR